MEIRVNQAGDVTVVKLDGNIDAITAPQIAGHLSGLVSKGHIKLAADFSAVEYTSSAGLRVLLGAIKETRAQGGDLRLAAVQPDVLKVLKLSGFTSILKLYDDVVTTVASFA